MTSRAAYTYPRNTTGRARVATYSDVIVDHFENPRNEGELDEPTHVVKVGDPVCGDTIQLSVVHRDSRIVEASSGRISGRLM